MEKVRQVGGHTGVMETSVAESNDFVLDSSLNRKPVKCSEKRCCALTSGLAKNESGCMILNSLKFVEFVVRKASQERVTVI